MGSISEPTPNPWVRTPCIKSAALSQEAGCNIYLKLENLQPSGSFKSRGVGHLMSRALQQHGHDKPIHFYCSSGGNAGLACVTAANTLQRPATIVVPTSTSSFMVEKLRTRGAHVVQKGKHWSEADTYLREELMANDEYGVYVPPFDHADVWAGHGSLIDELEAQMASQHGYDAIVCSVGGGGLFIGLMDALERHGRLRNGGRKEVKMLALETKGADSLDFSLKQKKLSRLPTITSIAGSLGATQVASKAYEWAQRPEVTNCVLSDAEAAMACVAFADDERILVEVACGVSIATAYNGTLRTLYPSLSDSEFAALNIVIVVCGGSNVNLQTLEEYRVKYGQDEDVVRKFHCGTRKMGNGTGVPFIAHSKKVHKEEVVCDDGLARRPAVGAIEEVEAAKQIYRHGKVVAV